jgi:hypothetical protein
VKRTGGNVALGCSVEIRSCCRVTIRSPVCNAVHKFRLVWANLDAAGKCLRHELIDELVEAGLTAEVFRSGT